MTDEEIIISLMNILDGFESDDEFETFIANAKMLWSTRDVAKEIAASGGTKLSAKN